MKLKRSGVLLLTLSGWLYTSCGTHENAANGDAAESTVLADSCYAPTKTVTDQVKKDWIAKMTPVAQEAERVHGVPAAALIAMSINESGFGTTKIFVNANNAFGWKYYGPESAEGRGYYVLACQPKDDPNNKYIKFADHKDGALFVAKKLATLPALSDGKRNYKGATDRYIQDRKNGVDVQTAVNRWINSIADAGYNWNPSKYKKDITKAAQDFSLYQVSSSVTPKS